MLNLSTRLAFTAIRQKLFSATHFNLFLANASILYPPPPPPPQKNKNKKTPQNQKFSGVFRVYKIRTLARSRFISFFKRKYKKSKGTLVTYCFTYHIISESSRIYNGNSSSKMLVLVFEWEFCGNLKTVVLSCFVDEFDQNLWQQVGKHQCKNIYFSRLWF